MTKPTRAVQVRLTDSERRYLDELVSAGRYASRSAALRAGVRELMAKYGVRADLERWIELERLCLHYNKPGKPKDGRAADRFFRERS